MSRPLARLVAVSAVGTLALSACAPGSTSSGPQPGGTGPATAGSVRTDPASLGEVGGQPLEAVDGAGPEGELLTREVGESHGSAPFGRASVLVD